MLDRRGPTRSTSALRSGIPEAFGADVHVCCLADLLHQAVKGASFHLVRRSLFDAHRDFTRGVEGHHARQASQGLPVPPLGWKEEGLGRLFYQDWGPARSFNTSQCALPLKSSAAACVVCRYTLKFAASRKVLGYKEPHDCVSLSPPCCPRWTTDSCLRHRSCPPFSTVRCLFSDQTSLS